MAEASASTSGPTEGAATAAPEREARDQEQAAGEQQPTTASSPPLPPAPTTAAGQGDDEATSAPKPAAAPEEETGEASTSAAAAAAGGVLQTPSAPPAAVTRGRSDSLAIMAANETLPPAGPDSGHICNITLLLPTGSRHPFRIDDRYLAKRGVEVPDTTDTGHKDPFSISVYKLKELILREWREEWEGKPASPSSIRLIHFGKLLDDKEQLRRYHFTADSPNVVHMSVKPPEMQEDDEAAKGAKSGSRDGRARESNSGCCVIL